MVTMPARSGRRPRSRVDTWMDQAKGSFASAKIKRQTIALVALGAPAFLPMLFVVPAVATGNGAALNTGEADTLGTGSEILLILTLLITPLVTLTGQRWFVPLRKWYGVVLAVNATCDGIIASITTQFVGGPVGRVAGHTFLLAGLVIIMILIPLALISNRWAMRRLGRYWAWLQRLTYLVWALLFVHLMLLEGLGYQQGLNGSGTDPDGIPILHQRVYQFAVVSIFLLTVRLPPVRRWITAKREQGKQWQAWLALSPVVLLFLLGMVMIIHEMIFKGLDMFRLHPSSE